MKATNDFTKLAHMIRKLLIKKSKWLLHVDIFFKKVLKKDIVGIKMENKPFKLHNKRENKVNGCWLYYRAEHGMKVNARTLVKSFCH